MPQVWKDSLYPGTYRLADGRRWTCRDDEIPTYYQRLREMLDAEVPMPFQLEHQPIPKNLSWDDIKAQKVRNNLGEIKDARLHPDGFIELLLNVHDEEDMKLLPKNRFVSPTIDEAFNPRGSQVWDKAIVGVALTPRPIQTQQKPFTQFATGSSLSAVCLSLEGYSPIYLGADMAEENDKPKEKDSDTESSGGDSGGDKIKKAVATLAKLGMMLGEDTTIENLVDRIIVAGDTKEAVESGSDVVEDEVIEDQPLGDQPLDDITPATDVPFIMSMNGGKKRTPQEVKALARHGLHALKSSVEGVKGRIAALVKAKVIDEAKGAALSAEFAKAPVLLSASGTLQPSAPMIRLETYEEVAKKARPSGAIKLSAGQPGDVEPEKRPENHAGMPDENACKATGREMAGILGYKPRAK